MSLPLALVLLAAAGDWPGFLGPAGDGTSAEVGVRAWGAAGPTVVWECELGEGYAAPVVAAGKLYTFDRQGDRNRLTCRDARTGKSAWTFEYRSDYEDLYGYSNGPRCCPVVDGDRVYLFGAEGTLVCVDAQKGTEVWKVDTTKTYNVHQNFFGVGSTPVVEGDLLLVGVGGSPPGRRPDDFLQVRPNGSAVVAFNKKTGVERWRTGDDLASYASPTVRTIAGKRVGLHFARGGLVAFDPASGAARARFPWRARILESVNASNPITVGDRVLITECYGPGSALLELQAGDFKAVWDDRDAGRDKRLQCHWNTPVAAGGFVYGSSGRNTAGAELRCVNVETGEVAWEKRGLGRASLTLADGHLICLGEEGALRLLKADPKAYNELCKWEPAELAYPCWAAPVLSNGLLYVRGKGRLLCVELIPPGSAR